MATTAKTHADIIDGDQRAIAAAIRRYLTCDEHKCEYVRVNKEGSWTCPRGTSCSRIIGAGLLFQYVDAVAAPDGTNDRVVRPKDKVCKRTGKVIKADPADAYTIDGRTIQIERIIKALDMRCGWTPPKWKSYYTEFLRQREKQDASTLCVMRIGSWFAAYSTRMKRSHTWIGDAEDMVERFRWKAKQFVAGKDEKFDEIVARVAFSAFDHDGKIEAKLTENKIVIL